MNNNEKFKNLILDTYNWLNDPYKLKFSNILQKYGGCPNKIYLPKQLIKTNIFDKPIAIIQQFYISKNLERHNENIKTLIFNVNNKFIDKIILLNERIYTDDELGITSDKIIQININDRLTYKLAIEYAMVNLKNHYIILSNSDIFFDETINNIKYYNLNKHKSVICQLRLEYNNNISTSSVDWYRPDCQDTWIWYSNCLNLNNTQLNAFNFCLGIGGCDNRVCALFSALGAHCYNQPNDVKTYHFHTTQVRNWQNQEKINGLYNCIAPLNNINYKKFWVFHPYYCSIMLNEKLKKNINYIPNTFGITMELITIGFLLNTDKTKYFSLYNKALDLFKKNNIDILSIDDLINFSLNNMRLIKNTEIRFWKSPFDKEFTSYVYSYVFIENNLNQTAYDTRLCNAFAIKNITPKWTDCFSNKKICLLTNYFKEVQANLSKRISIIGFDAFKNCKIKILQSPKQYNKLNNYF